MKFKFRFLLNISVFVIIAATTISAQIDFRRPSGMKVTQQPAKETPQPPVRTAPTGEEKNNAFELGLREFVVEPGETGAVIKFKAPAGSSPVVEIGLVPPTLGPSGKLEFSSRLSLVTANIVTDKNALQQVNYKADIAALDQGTRYYYLVSTKDARLQTRDYFRTVSSTVQVTVVYTSINVTNDSDDGGNGELFFQFFASGAKGAGENDGRTYGSCKQTLSWNDRDPARQINESIEIGDAGNTLNVAVNGWDEDGVGPLPQGCANIEPLSRPYNDYDYEGNVARKSFDLNSFKEAYQRVDFEMSSLPHAAGEGDLSFIVKGYLEIRRERRN